MDSCSCLMRSMYAGFLLAVTGGVAGTVNAQPSGTQPWWSDNARWAADLAARSTWDIRQKKAASQFVLGYDYHKVFTRRGGDVGTLVFQPYLVKLKDVSKHPFFFDDKDDVALTWRIANFNYTALSNGEFNIRVGHFEVPFGLEQNIDTNGTLRQYTFSDRGIKADWGVSVNGTTPALDYEVALTRGSGNEYLTKSDPYVFSGRVGTSSIRNFVAGFSWLKGEILTGTGTVEKNRLGVDIAYYYKQWEVLFELSGGDNSGNKTANALAELSWRNPSEDIHSYLQLRYLRAEDADQWNNSNNAVLGVNWQVNRSLDLGTQYFKELDTLAGEKAASRVLVQARMRL